MIFGIFILEIEKFRQKFAAETLRENGVANEHFFAKEKFSYNYFLQKENFFLKIFTKKILSIVFFLL